jgi:hypothetical protein
MKNILSTLFYGKLVGCDRISVTFWPAIFFPILTSRAPRIKGVNHGNWLYVFMFEEQNN